MRVMIWKELKWNSKWALIGCGVYCCCLGMLYWVFDHGPVSLYEGLLSLGVQIVTAIGFPAFGLLLGFLQVFFESRRDSWAFLVHRPLSRGRVFWSKVIAGLLLYFAALLIPSALFLLWFLSSLPLPFEWGVALPALSDMLTGVVYYFAGLLVGLRQARWYGSRLLPILAASLVSVQLFILGMWSKDYYGRILVPRAWFAIWLMVFVISIALALAAYGAFQTGGAFTRQPRTCKWGLAVCLTAAGAVLFGASLLCLGSTVDRILYSLERAFPLPAKERVVTREPAKERRTWTEVTKDGRVVTVVADYSRIAGSRHFIVAILDQLGKPVREFESYIGQEPHRFEAETMTLVYLYRCA